VTALVPTYLWCSGRSSGLPAFPIYALTFTWTFGLPLMMDHPSLTDYGPDDHLIVGMAVSGFLLLGTLLWLAPSRPRPHHRRVLLVVYPGRGVAWLLASLGLNAVFQLGKQAGWLAIPAGLYPIVAAVLLGLSTVAAFMLPYLWGRRELRTSLAVTAAALFVLDGIASMTGLLLVNVLAKFAVAVLGLTLGERRFRIVPVAVVLALLVPLHYGKHRMRDAYWYRSDAESTSLAPAQYPDFFAQWVQYSIENITTPDAGGRAASFSTRASLVQLFLLARERQREGAPALNGASYAIIPSLLLPRALVPDKPASHEGTYLLNIHYGLQRREDTRTTTIGWGLFNEAFGNFGYTGIAGLALFLGAVLGGYARWTQRVPELSARFLLAVLVLMMASQTEFSAGVLVSSLFQFTAVLGGLLLLLGARRQVVR
jgi:hypothetical protein